MEIEKMKNAHILHTELLSSHKGQDCLQDYLYIKKIMNISNRCFLVGNSYISKFVILAIAIVLKPIDKFQPSEFHWKPLVFQLWSYGVLPSYDSD